MLGAKKYLKDLFVVSDNNSIENICKTPLKWHIAQNFRVVWLHTSIDESKNDFHGCIDEPMDSLVTTNTFADVDQCIDFLTELIDDNVLMVLSGTVCSLLVPLIHDIVSVNTIVVFRGDNLHDREWTQKWMKVHNDFADTKSFYDSLKLAVHQYEHNAIPISFISIDDVCNKNMDQLDQSFMYTQILKEILFEIDYNEQSIKEFTVFCSQIFCGNDTTLMKILTFEKNYHVNSPIWWYTYENFLYSMLNRALRSQDVKKLIKMGFFIHDLHQQIEKLHLTQFDDKHQPLTTYRGQSLSKGAFEKLMLLKNGLISFNNFLSTSEDRDVAFAYAESCSSDVQSVGILFEITIDPSISRVHFARINDFTNYESEKEILFSMHSVFRIREINMVNDNNNLWVVKLQNTDDNDNLLSDLTERIRHETEGTTGWHRLSALLLRLGQFDQAEHLCLTILDHYAFDDEDRALTLNQLGFIKKEQGDYIMATKFYDQAYELLKTILPKYHPKLIQCMNNFGSLSMEMGDYSTALRIFKISLAFQKHMLPEDHLNLVYSYSSIGDIHVVMNDYPKALEAYTKGLEITTKLLPPIHPTLGTLHRCIGCTYNKMGDYTKALASYKKSLEILLKSLPTDHPDMATSYNDIGFLYFNMGEYFKALSCVENALEICRKNFSFDHPDFATCLRNMGQVYDSMGAHSKALEFYEKAFEIYRKVLPPEHPAIAHMYDTLGSLYLTMGEDSKALTAFEKALEIYQKTLPPNHLNLACLYNHIGDLYRNPGEYQKALLFCTKGLVICQETLPEHHPILLVSYHNVGKIYQAMGDYSKALAYFEKALAIQEKTLTPNHQGLAYINSSIGELYSEMKDYPKALVFFEKALAIRQKILPPNHLDLAMSYCNVGDAYKAMGNPLKALPFLQHFVGMFQD